MSSADPSATPRTAPRALWRIAAALLRTLHALFGDPARIARQHTLTAKSHAHLASWLRSAEAMLRHLLVIEASAYPKPNTRPLLAARRSRTRKLMGFTPDEPEKWRVSFRCFASPPRKHWRKAPSAAAAARLERLRILGARPGEPIFICREGRRTRSAPALKERYILPARRRAASTRAHVRGQDRFWVHERDLKPLVFHSAWPLAERYEALLRAFNDPAPYARRLARRLHATPHRIAEALRAPDAGGRIERFEKFYECAKRAWRSHWSSA